MCALVALYMGMCSCWFVPNQKERVIFTVQVCYTFAHISCIDVLRNLKHLPTSKRYWIKCLQPRGTRFDGRRGPNRHNIGSELRVTHLATFYSNSIWSNQLVAVIFAVSRRRWWTHRVARRLIYLFALVNRKRYLFSTWRQFCFRFIFISLYHWPNEARMPLSCQCQMGSDGRCDSPAKMFRNNTIVLS